MKQENDTPITQEMDSLIDIDDREEKSNKGIIEQIIESPPIATELDLTRLNTLMDRMEAELEEPKDGSSYFTVRFPFRASVIQRLERIFTMSDPNENVEEAFHDGSFHKILATIKEFMIAFSHGELKTARNALKNLAQQQEQSELYKELGTIARNLHESLKNLGHAIDPQLREFVEEKLPDSGHRLEHILRITENAANVTLDRLEQLQSRRSETRHALSELEQNVTSLYPMSDKARTYIENITNAVKQMQYLMEQDKEDFSAILTAQDFQDLTGQIIIKIMDILQELEQKLVDLVTTFGIRLRVKEEKAWPSEQQLYGPAHEKKEGALKSQNEVDSLLAEFGF